MATFGGCGSPARQEEPNNAQEAVSSLGEGHFLDPDPRHLIIVPCFEASLGPAASLGLDFHSLRLTFDLTGSAFLQGQSFPCCCLVYFICIFLFGIAH